MDPLSDVLSTLRIRSSVSKRCESVGRWALAFPAYPSQIKFGSVLQGGMNLRMQGARAPVRFGAGDFYLLCNSRPFVTTSIPAGAPVQDGPAAYRAARGADGVVRVGKAMSAQDAEDKTVLMSGAFALEGEASRLLLRHLPPLVHLRAGDPATRPLRHLLELLRDEDDAARPGTSIAQTSLAALLLVQALRIHLQNASQPRGWLGAMTDRRVGRALYAMHADLTQPWTVDRLAGEAGMSRTAFSVRFKELVGAPPLEYLTEWRMAVARDLLVRDAMQVAAVGERVGYQSDTAFSAAFKRVTGTSPALYRKSADTAP